MSLNFEKIDQWTGQEIINSLYLSWPIFKFIDEAWIEKEFVVLVTLSEGFYRKVGHRWDCNYALEKHPLFIKYKQCLLGDDRRINYFDLNGLRKFYSIHRSLELLETIDDRLDTIENNAFVETLFTEYMDRIPEYIAIKIKPALEFNKDLRNILNDLST